MNNNMKNKLNNENMDNIKKKKSNIRRFSKDLRIDRNTLDEFLKIEREIAQVESNNPMQPLELKTDQLVRLNQEIDQLEEHIRDLEKESSKFGEKMVDAVETRQFFIENGIQEDPLTPEQEKYLDTANKKEIAAQELEAHKKQRDQVSKEIAELETKANHLHELYKRHDNLLDRMFGDQYGSELENQLEAELDDLEAHRGRIMEANFKWRQAQMMLEYACKQLAIAVQKWQDLPALPTIDLEIRYSVAAETRNNLVAASQNIQGAQRYLDNVNFPYCAPSEVDTLNKAAEYVFTDMQSPDRHDHAQSCYSTTYKRANALLQWFDTVINTTIMKDLHDINQKVMAKTLELRRERVRLIQEKAQQMWGTNIDLDTTLGTTSVDLDQLSRGLVTDGQAVKVDGDVESQRAGTPPPLSEDELAPMPSNTVIFGNMYDHYQQQLDNLARQHREEMEQFMREQESNTRRINDNLQDKLVARRHRRARMRVEEAQKKALSG
ncbi:DNA repair protein RAD50 isoform X3 [Cherax quadricarinatus]|uniref:DNA repair protein RAD50 isoform X3 n=1 Tax=Cherax quadricarinatus TaxID=27406 RepID=UPI00387E49CF